ncbi:hypothetical protein, partial [Salmonella enterica]|uniref:hypothetical protein n=1 Tax=Salmonella enterica TaxID=28901 RepID=UPI003F6E26B4
QNHTDCPLTDFGGKTSIFSHPVYLFLRKFSLQDSRGGSQVNSFQQEECLGADKFSHVENGGFLAVHVCFSVSCDDFDVKTGCRHSGA